MSQNLKSKMLTFVAMMHRLIQFSLALLPIFAAAQSRIPYEFRQLTINDGLPDNAIYGCQQDSHGYLWFFTVNGASRFDGRRFENFNIAEGLADNEILNAFEDSRQRLWFNSFNGRLAYFDLMTEHIVSYRTDSSLERANGDAYIGAFAEDTTDGSLWLLIEHSVVKRIFRDGSVRQYVPSRSTFGLFRNHEGQIVTASDTFKIYNRQRDAFEIWAQPDGNLSLVPHFSGRQAFNGNTLFFEKMDGIYSFFKGKIQKIVPRSVLKGEILRGLSTDTTGGNLWLGVSNGVHQFSLAQQKVIAFYPTNAPVSRVCRDRENNVWICTMGKGVFFYPSGNERIRRQDRTSGLASNEVTSLAYDAAGNLVAATFPNFLNLLDANGRVFQQTKIIGEWDTRVQRMWFRGSDIWLQTDNNRLDKFMWSDIKQFVLKKSANGISSHLTVEMPVRDFISAISPVKNTLFASDGRIFIAATSLIVLQPTTKDRVRFRFLRKKSRSRFYGLAETAYGTIWVGGTEGVGFCRPTDTALTFLNLSFETTVNDILPLSADGAMLVSTTGSGVFLLKNKQILRNWRETDGLSSNACTRLLRGGDGAAFVATAKGVTRLRFDTTDFHRADLTVFGGENSKPALHVNDLLLSGDMLHIATNDGLYSFKINDLDVQKNLPLTRFVEPRALISQPDSVLQLPYGWTWRDNAIRFQCRSIAFLNGEKMVFRYRLFKSDDLIKSDSMRLSEDFTLALASLTSGAYRLEVESSRGDGIWSAPVVGRFVVPSVILRQPVMIAVYILLCMALIYSILRLISFRRERRRRQQIEAQEERLSLERRQLEWEQEAVRARIDPHFIFNALNGILAFAYKRDFDSIKNDLPRLARLIRQSLQLGKADFIEIRTEMRYLTDYLMLEKMRFEQKFDFSVRCTEGVQGSEKVVPPLLLQIFVENALKHGIGELPENAPTGFIEVVFSKNADGILICQIRDNGVGFSHSLAMKKGQNGDHISMGLTLARRRIDLLNQLFDRNYCLTMADTEGGTCVELTMKNRDLPKEIKNAT